MHTKTERLSFQSYFMEKIVMGIGRMKKSLEEGNYKNYCVEAHAIKSLMATIGVKVLSERGRKHEFASRDGDIDFVKGDCDAFYEDYRKVCSVITQALEE